MNLPRFLFCEQPIKTGTFQDQRMWIYCPPALSLIEAIPEDEITVAINRDLIQKRYRYNDESYLLVFTQNNADYAEINPADLMDEAWQWLCKYFAWEDQQIR